MLIDTHCHMNLIVKQKFDLLLSRSELDAAQSVINDAATHHVTRIINVGTSLIESKNCVALAQQYSQLYAAVGIHPNDLTEQWQQDMQKIVALLNQDALHNIVAIGECGMDKHYPGYNITRQEDAFKYQIELALQHNKAIIVHTRDAPDETLKILELYHKDKPRTVIHCFSETLSFAQQVIDWGFYLGIGGTVTYPKNERLRTTLQKVGLDHVILETDAPYLPPQIIRGKKNSPQHIDTIAHYIANMLNVSLEHVAQQTSSNADKLFKFNK